MSKIPVNHSVSWETLAALSPLIILYAMAKNFYTFTLPPAHITASYALFTVSGLGGIIIAHDYISSLPARRMKVAFETTGIYINREAGIRLPRLKRKVKEPWGWRLYYSLPIGLSKNDFDKNQEAIEAALDAEVNFSWRQGFIRADVLVGKIPLKVDFELPELKGEIPFSVGIGREGLITADLAACPHLLVAGQTGAGKSNFLHQMIACLLSQGIKLYIIDLKQVEFAYLSRHAVCEYTLDGAIRTLEHLTKEMHRRMAFLAKAGFVSAKEWRQAHPDRAEELPYMVLIVDEFSQLSPVLSKADDDRKLRTYTHKMLVDLICLARSLGIHLVVATQRPDSDILPGQLKANMPATICFRVRNETNSKICLDNHRAADLPDTPGRAIWQLAEEREVQTYYLPMDKARAYQYGEVAAAEEEVPGDVVV